MRIPGLNPDARIESWETRPILTTIQRAIFDALAVQRERIALLLIERGRQTLFLRLLVVVSPRLHDLADFPWI